MRVVVRTVVLVLVASFSLIGGCAAPRAVPVRPIGTEVVARIEKADRQRRHRDLEGAWKTYRKALEDEPASVRAHVGVQEVLRGRGLELEARALYRGLDDPYLTARLEESSARARPDYERCDEPFRSLGLGRLAWRKAKFREALHLFRRATQVDPGRAAGWLSLGQVLLAERRYGEAYEAFRNAVWLAPDHPGGWFGISHAAVRLGRDGAALVTARAAFKRTPLDAAAADRLANAARRTRDPGVARAGAALLCEPGSARSVRAYVRAAALYSTGGDVAGRDRSLGQALKAGAVQGEIEAAISKTGDAELHEFLEIFATGVRARYRHFRATDEAESMKEFRDWARSVYERTTGETLDPAGEIESYAFVGDLVDPTRGSGEPLVVRLADRGLLLVLGRRSGGPPEAMLARVVRRTRMEDVRSRGTTVRREVAWIGRRYVSGYVEWQGGGDLAGLALGNLVLIDVHAAARWEGELRRRRAELLPEGARILTQRALMDAPVDAVDDPAGVAERLLLGSEIDVVAEVLVHEDAHLVDADRYLPGRGSLLRGFGLALQSGLSADRVLAVLERNAELTAIAEGPHPRLALANCCAALGGRGVHARGYTAIVRAMVRRIVAEPERYPAIDAERVVVQQLHRLTDGEIRALAVALQEKWGVR